MITNFNLYEIDSFFDKKKLNKKPEFLYHLTSGENFNKIIKNGLSVKSSIYHQFVQGIYLTDSMYIASTYKFEKENCHIIEIHFNKLNSRYMKPDDWELFQIIDDDWEDIKEYFDIFRMNERDKQIIWETLDYRHSLYICEQLIYTRNIPSNLFSNVYDEIEIEKMLNLK